MVTNVAMVTVGILVTTHGKFINQSSQIYVGTSSYTLSVTLGRF